MRPIQTAIFELRRAAYASGLSFGLEPALEPLAQGSSASAAARLGTLDQRLADLANDPHFSAAAARARSQILAVTDAITQHREYFDSGV